MSSSAFFQILKLLNEALVAGSPAGAPRCPHHPPRQEVRDRLRPFSHQRPAAPPRANKPPPIHSKHQGNRKMDQSKEARAQSVVTVLLLRCNLGSLKFVSSSYRQTDPQAVFPHIRRDKAITDKQSRQGCTDSTRGDGAVTPVTPCYPRYPPVTPPLMIGLFHTDVGPIFTLNSFLTLIQMNLQQLNHLQNFALSSSK